MQIENLADHPGIIDTLALWHFTEWGHADPAGSARSWAAGLRKRTNRDRIPATYVALNGRDLLGSVTLTDHDMGSHMELSPWLAGLFVKPEKRGMGIGTALTLYAMRAAAQMGIARLYLHTESARDFYVKFGWQRVAEEIYEGQVASIMQLDLEPNPAGGPP